MKSLPCEKIYWVGFTQEFEEGNWRNGYYHGMIEAKDPGDAIRGWYGTMTPPDMLQVFEYKPEQRIKVLVHTVGLH